MNHPLHPTRWVTLLFASMCVVSCRGKSDEAKLQSEVRPTSAIAPSGGDGAAPGSDGSLEDAQFTLDPELPLGDGGTWIESDYYYFKLESAKYCSKAPAKSDAGNADTVILGAKVQIKAKVNEFFVNGRHATLRDKEAYFQSMLDGTAPGCAPTIKPIQIKRGEVAAGYILFELPNPWKNLFLEYQPVRWGGAAKVRVSIPNLKPPT